MHVPSDDLCEQSPDQTPVRRRQLLHTLASLGIGTAVFQRALADEASKTGALTAEQIAGAEWIAGIRLTDPQRESLKRRLTKMQRDSDTIQNISLSFDSLPAFRFDPEMADPSVTERAQSKPEWLSPVNSGSAPEHPEPGMSFQTIRELGRRLRSRETSAVQLATHCLSQLQDHDPVLNCVVTLTEDLAMLQAEQADRELAAGHDRGPLHGIPWGAKDLMAVAGYATTWGAPQFRDQQLPVSATVVRRLEAAGAVHVAKLSLGALAMGDQWFMGQTKNPWNPDQGSSGSSAGSASAVSAGLIPFSLGSETLGSIISPTRRCGVMGLRPTFGRVSRFGCMALSWTMDKIGPIARSADDCGLVFKAIHGRDERDPTTVDRWYEWPVRVDFRGLQIGRVINCETAPPEAAAIEILKDLGARIVDIELPRDIPEWSLTGMLDVEAACVFQSLTRSGNTEGLNAWADIFRASHFVSAVDFLQAQRARFRIMQQMTEVFRKVSLYVGGDDLGIANLTGHPSLTLPVMMTEAKPQQRPLCCTLTSGLYDEATLLAVAREIEQRARVLKFRPVF